MSLQLMAYWVRHRINLKYPQFSIFFSIYGPVFYGLSCFFCLPTLLNVCDGNGFDALVVL